MAAEGVEGFLDLPALEPVSGARDVFEAGQRRQRRSLRSLWILSRHVRYASTPPFQHGCRRKYDPIIGRKGSLP